MPRERRRRAAEGARPQERAPRGPARKERAGARRTLLGCASALALLGLLLGLGLRARWGATSLLTAPHPAGRALGANSSGAAAAPGLFWGSYRPQVYLGMKTRSPRSPVAGARTGGSPVSRAPARAGARLPADAQAHLPGLPVTPPPALLLPQA